jgi:hypothetical protein
VNSSKWLGGNTSKSTLYEKPLGLATARNNFSIMPTMNKSRPIPADYLELWQQQDLEEQDLEQQDWEQDVEQEEEEGSNEYSLEEMGEKELGFSDRLGKWETLKFPDEMFPTTVKVGLYRKTAVFLKV